MKLMDKNGKFFGKIHFFDLLIVVLLIAGIAGMAVRFVQSEEKAAQTMSAVYTFEITGAPDYYTDAYQLGDTVYEGEVLMGTITNVELKTHQTLHIMEDGTAKMIDRPTYYDIILTVSTDDLIQQSGYYIGTQEILNGTGHSLKNGIISCYGTVREIKIAE